MHNQEPLPPDHQPEELAHREQIHRPTFLEIMAWHNLSIGLISYYCRVPIWRVLKMAQHRPVDRSIVEWVLSELSLLTNVTYTLATVEMATCESGTEADEALDGEIWLSHHPTFQQVRQFHDLTIPALARLTGLPIEAVIQLDQYGIGEGKDIDCLLQAISRLSGFMYTRDLIACTILESHTKHTFLTQDQLTNQEERTV